MIDHCPRCGYDLTQIVPVPPEPPVGTIVKDRHGVLISRYPNGHWGESGMVPMALWEPMWQAHGPLIIQEGQ
jgi:hypothetical protein